MGHRSLARRQWQTAPGATARQVAGLAPDNLNGQTGYIQKIKAQGRLAVAPLFFRPPVFRQAGGRCQSENGLAGNAVNITPADADIVQLAGRKLLKLPNGRAEPPPIVKAAKKRICFSSHDRHSLSRVVCFDRHIGAEPALVQCNICMADLPKTQGGLMDCERRNLGRGESVQGAQYNQFFTPWRMPARLAQPACRHGGRPAEFPLSLRERVARRAG